MQTLETSRGRLEFRYDRRAQGCVLLLNGGHTNPDMRDSERYFIDRGHGVISVARPGYCHTSAKLDEAFGGFERAVGELLDHLDLTAVKVLGVSAGGRSAMRFAQLLPERCTHLVLFSSTSFQPRPGTALRLGTYLGFNPVAERFTWAILRSALRKWPQWTTERLFSSLTTLDAQEVLASYSAEARRDIFELFMEMRSGAGFVKDIGARARRGSASAISAPTLIVHSRFDRQVSSGHATKIARDIPNARLIMNDTESHLMWMSPRWREVEQELDLFLA